MSESVNVYHPVLIHQLVQQANGDSVVEDAHYKGFPFEVVDIAEAYGLTFNEGNVVKYILRWRRKDGLEDLVKAKKYIERLISLEERRLQEAGE